MSEDYIELHPDSNYFDFEPNEGFAFPTSPRQTFMSRNQQIYIVMICLFIFQLLAILFISG